MQSPEKLKRHARLVDDMATVQGVDLEEHILRGNLTIGDLDDAVLRCTGCSQPCSCESWLAERKGPAEAPPDYCRNTRLFSQLRKGAQ